MKIKYLPQVTSSINLPVKRSDARRPGPGLKPGAMHNIAQVDIDSRAGLNFLTEQHWLAQARGRPGFWENEKA